MSNIYTFFDDIIGISHTNYINVNNFIDVDNNICATIKNNTKNADVMNNVNVMTEICRRRYSTPSNDPFYNHINILKDAYEKRYDNILVFEENADYTDSYNLENMENAIEFMKNNDTWDILYLGYNCFSYQSKYNYNMFDSIFNSYKITKNVIKCNMTASYSVCYNKRSMKKILDTYEDYSGIITYDKYLAEYIDLNNYCYTPMLFKLKSNNFLEHYCNININYDISLLKYNYTCNKYNFYILCIMVIISCILKCYTKMMLDYDKKLIMNTCANKFENHLILKILLRYM